LPGGATESAADYGRWLAGAFTLRTAVAGAALAGLGTGMTEGFATRGGMINLA
jgi:hypothetical protein